MTRRGEKKGAVKSVRRAGTVVTTKPRASASKGAGRQAASAARRTAKKTGAAPGPADAKSASKVSVSDPAGERDALRRELAEAKQTIKALEGRLAALADRIAWTLDSLHSLLDEPG